RREHEADQQALEMLGGYVVANRLTNSAGPDAVDRCADEQPPKIFGGGLYLRKLGHPAARQAARSFWKRLWERKGPTTARRNASVRHRSRATRCRFSAETSSTICRTSSTVRISRRRSSCPPSHDATARVSSIRSCKRP